MPQYHRLAVSVVAIQIFCMQHIACANVDENNMFALLRSDVLITGCSDHTALILSKMHISLQLPEPIVTLICTYTHAQHISNTIPDTLVTLFYALVAHTRSDLESGEYDAGEPQRQNHSPVDIYSSQRTPASIFYQRVVCSTYLLPSYQRISIGTVLRSLPRCSIVLSRSMCTISPLLVFSYIHRVYAHRRKANSYCPYIVYI